MEYIRSVIAQDESVSAGDVDTFDLPVNPLSHVVVTLKGLNVTDEATLAEILARLSKVEVLHRGAAVISMSGADLHAFNAAFFGNMPILSNQIATDNATRAISFIVPMGRDLYNPAECFPATNKGELQLQLTYSSTETAIDGLIIQVEAVELIGANPTQHLKVTTLSKTPAATGDLDVDMPIANDIIGLLLFSTTIPATTAWTTTVDKVKMLVDSKEYLVASANWESLHGELLNRIGHREAYDASADNDDIANYALMDFDPKKDGAFALETRGKSSVKLRVTAGDTNVFRVLPWEIVKV